MLELQRTRDEEQLRLLRILNYVFAAICSLGVMISLVQLSLWHSDSFQRPFDEVEVNTFAERRAPLRDPAETMATMESVITVVLVTWLLFGVTVAVLSFLNARMLTQRRNRSFSMVVAGVQCLAVPLGTLLGVFTFVVLGRPTVVQAYGDGPEAVGDR